MKKYLIIFVLALMAFHSHAQIFSTITYYDKFDDVLKSEHRKSLITKTDSTIVVEEKGKQPVEYYIFDDKMTTTRGSKDEPVNLVEDLYGYDTTWIVIPMNKLQDLQDALSQTYVDSKEEVEDIFKTYCLVAVHRTITTQYTGSYLDELFWIQDLFRNWNLGKDVDRIIYEKE